MGIVALPHVARGSFTMVQYGNSIGTIFSRSCLNLDQKFPENIWSEWRMTVIAATVRIALVDILDLSEVDIPAGGFLYPCLLYTSPSPRD